MNSHKAFELYYKLRGIQRATIKQLGQYMDNHGIERGGCTIHGDDGPVWYANISDHPKVRAKMGPGK